MQHPVNKRDEVRRAYLLLGPYQPRLKYPRSKFGKQYRGFNFSWFAQHPWLEYSPSKDAAYCFQCFLFESDPPKHSAFTSEGFKRWCSVNNGSACAFLKHSGNVDSGHSTAQGNSEALKNSAQRISLLVEKQSIEAVTRHRLRLKTTIDCLRWLARQQCDFRGHDESKGSRNRGNFIELIKYSASLNKDVNAVVLENATGNATYTSPKIQKEILNIISNRVRSKIREEIGNAKYCILVDESRDASKKEQMVIVLRYVDIDGYVQERFFDIQHVENTCALTLKNGITKILNYYDLQVENMRGQGYDGASNMRGQWNGLQALFREECKYAYYVHCFSHRLQLALVKTAETLGPVWKFYSMLSSIVNLVTSSSHRFGDFQSAQEDEIAKRLSSGELETGKGANQIGTLPRATDTRWSSHYGSVCSLIDKFEATCTTIDHIGASDPKVTPKVGEAQSISEEMRSFRFVFVLHLMFKIMGITEILCQGLQKKKQDIVNAMALVSNTKV
ncbi:zinc finger MYM-type protein 1-like isoform X1 [Papaver somniferum]|uniref:zinc finger MYM-type protein 1-like isoform X1 n=1 Tax=Papaver somniferum TaxID=3469 RepID=UPI000E6F9432|nr:zinc finger MYM-type protein 1-like isoform X1 [Papaver somniferum]XP_026439906.1 zinc finger MYM-type protein 1-like isoform X1 [Papaver somniferum]XP_026439907.1 zinc finger MYM-type protein 1-like isoform X1 [Papaver somniferum]XP_026439908.1 zinc finger MYM-type protein 1-like isoform X1 [Papaver somniferum]XP_026439909.1 zinc finger MYM-type protein 1-like isoform X1 [Papaver somniferum]